ncbi:MAG: TraM recognition domain-containing protein [Clostridia bacterium]|nr:TraM recognition domain-containing protein [Clostridia bacterium]
MEHIDKFLKKLKTDRNTFLTYVLTLISFYLCIDRIVEVIFIAATGMYVDLWGPIQYTLAIFCVVFAFHFSGASKFVTEDRIKLSFLYLHMIGLYIIGISMMVQWVNALCWFGFFMVPNYAEIIVNFKELIKPAFSAFAWFLPIVGTFPLFKEIYTIIDDTKDIRDSIFDYGGIDLSDQSKGWGPYTCEMFLCKDSETGKAIKIPEARRFESTLVVGVSGAGKTSMIFEPMIARDLEKKYFYKEAAKEMGYTALRTGLANLKSPYSNEYMNSNFHLGMIKPAESKEKLYKAYMSKLVLTTENNKYIYKNLGLTYMAPDYESINTIKEVAKNFGIKYHIVDPTDPASVGINPFIFDDPIKTSIAISSVLKDMFHEDSERTTHAISDSYLQNLAAQAIENLTLLLYEMYPIEHDNDIPTLEDLLKLLYNFDEIERLSEKMKQIPELAEKYQIQLQYYKANFYRDSPNKEETLKQLQTLTAQLANLIRYPGIKNVLCNKVNNINYEKALKHGEVILVCTRRGDLGASVHQAFGTFLLLLMQHSVLSRPGTERTRVPHFLYIDEFPTFLSKTTSAIFTLYRKYRVGTIISAQNLSQFGTPNGVNYRQTVMANCSTKIVFGNNTPEDNDWWEKELGEKREWKATRDYEPQGLLQNTESIRKIIETEKTGPEYASTLKNITYAWTKNYAAGKVQSLKFKQILYKTKDTKGKNIVGKAKVDFLEESYKEEKTPKTYNFAKFSNGIIESSPDNENKRKKFDLKNISFTGTDSNPNDTDPIVNNTSDLDYIFQNDNAITNYSSQKRKNIDTNNSDDME